MAGAAGHQVVDVVGLVGAVEHHQPAEVRVAAAQRVAHRAQPLAVFTADDQAEGGGEAGQLLAQGAALTGAHPPHRVVLGGEPVDVLGGDVGLADAGQPVQGGDGGAGLGLLELLVEFGEQSLAAGEAGVAARHAAPDGRRLQREAGSGAAERVGARRRGSG